jgi:hypothetical protein
MELKDFRKELKSCGFRVKTESLSIGRHATIIRISDKQSMPSIFSGEEHRQQWIKAIAIKSEAKGNLWDKGEKIYT